MRHLVSDPVPEPSFQIYLAYDGSITSDWVARYAINMADNNGVREINLIHVNEGIYSQETIAKKIDAIKTHATSRRVELSTAVIPLSDNVLATLLRAVWPHFQSRFTQLWPLIPRPSSFWPA